MTKFTLSSNVQLSSGAFAMLHWSTVANINPGYSMPLLGFGVYQNYNATPTVLEAFRAGYRHVDSAQAYKNEADVGAAFRASGLKREDVFLSMLSL
ncbi:uncharacterized protein ARMOST_00787 [Armillaria ostoyae]|uniref:NADP-dependent oxidoreductase domain-containing protein n=1 Tax=Armillaria ostoyae TaxID=47428 RepID=A0A284QM41_ARMOS|nr:uncharacterized protein ARMOST_00787 [Armillaria ostoyae]